MKWKVRATWKWASWFGSVAFSSALPRLSLPRVPATKTPPPLQESNREKTISRNAKFFPWHGHWNAPRLIYSASLPTRRITPRFFSPRMKAVCFRHTAHSRIFSAMWISCWAFCRSTQVKKTRAVRAAGASEKTKNGERPIKMERSPFFRSCRCMHRRHTQCPAVFGLQKKNRAGKMNCPKLYRQHKKESQGRKY